MPNGSGIEAPTARRIRELAQGRTTPTGRRRPALLTDAQREAVFRHLDAGAGPNSNKALSRQRLREVFREVTGRGVSNEDLATLRVWHREERRAQGYRRVGPRQNPHIRETPRDRPRSAEGQVRAIRNATGRQNIRKPSLSLPPSGQVVSALENTGRWKVAVRGESVEIRALTDNPNVDWDRLVEAATKGEAEFYRTARAMGLEYAEFLGRLPRGEAESQRFRESYRREMRFLPGRESP